MPPWRLSCGDDEAKRSVNPGKGLAFATSKVVYRSCHADAPVSPGEGSACAASKVVYQSRYTDAQDALWGNT